MALPVPASSEPARSRRTVLAAAAGGLLAALAGALGRPAPAGASHLMGFGHANDAGAANTSLTTSSTGTALLVTQNGSGAALRGSAVGAGSIAGFFTANNGTGISGVTGQGDRYGVYGGNDAATSGGGAIRANGQQNHGLVATTAGIGTEAVRGINTSTLGQGIAVYGEGRIGVEGYGVTAASYGVVGVSSLSVGLYGLSFSDDAVQGYNGSIAYKAGIVGVNANPLGWAGYFEGNVRITGTLNPAIVLSAIDHPLDPANKTLAHATVGSPEMLNIYRGTIVLDASGEATVSLPAYFDALNGDVQYQLTAIGAAAPDLHVAAKVKDNRFTIAGGQRGMEVSWLVTGVRRDAYATANPIKVEEAKPAARRGRYLNPVAHGQAASKGWKDAPTLPELPVQPTPA